MKQDLKKIIDFIREKSAHPMKMKELAKELSIPSSEYASFRSAVKSLLEAGELVKLKRGRIGLADQMDIKVGKISITRGGTGFLLVEGDDEDINPVRSSVDGPRWRHSHGAHDRSCGRTCGGKRNQDCRARRA